MPFLPPMKPNAYIWTCERCNSCCSFKSRTPFIILPPHLQALVTHVLYVIHALLLSVDFAYKIILFDLVGVK